jgi:hypothetical protein
VDPVARVGAPAPDFELQDLDGGTHRLGDARGRILVLNFWASDCPWTERSDPAILAAVGGDGDVIYWPVAPNTDEDPERARGAIRAKGLPLLLLDPRQIVADQFGASTTPFVVVVDGQGVLRYRGAPDDSDFRKRQPTQSFLAQALEAVRAGRLPATSETPGRGCAIVRFHARER